MFNISFFRVNFRMQMNKIINQTTLIYVNKRCTHVQSLGFSTFIHKFFVERQYLLTIEYSVLLLHLAAYLIKCTFS